MKILSDFGPSVQTSVLYHLARLQGSSSVEETLRDPLRFSRALETIFSKGALIIEDKIIEAMCGNLGLEYEKTNGTFEEKSGIVHDLESNGRRPECYSRSARSNRLCVTPPRTKGSPLA